MIERSKIFAVDVGISKGELLRSINTKQNTRIPVYNGNLDDIIGFIHIKDILRNITYDFSIRDILRSILFVPPSMRISDVLIKMKALHTHAAIVVDEFGCTAGLITIVDIIEEVIGDIEDEHGHGSAPKFIKITDSKFEVSARLELVAFNARSNVKLPVSGYFRTIGGYIFHITGRVPSVGEKISVDNNIKIFIVDANEKSIISVIIDASLYNQEIKNNM